LRERFAKTSPDRELLAAYLEAGETVDKLRDLLLRCARADARAPRRFDAAHATAIGDALRAEFGTREQCARFLHEVNWKGQQRNAGTWVDTIAQTVAYATSPAGVLGACDRMREQANKVIKHAAGSPKVATAVAVLRDATRMMPLAE